MTEFLVELYAARTGAATVARWGSEARRAAEELTREGTRVRCLRSIFVPEDETCFLLYEAANEEDVRHAVRRAGLAVERITEAVATGVEEVGRS